MILFLLLLIPTAIALGTFIFGGYRVTWQEFVAQIVAQAVIVGVAMLCIYHMNTSDMEIQTGRVAEKTREKVHCEHSYSCNCRTRCSGSGKSRSCRTVCDTCYEHSYDVSWFVRTTNQESMTINRVDRRGMTEPPRWTAVRIGEPTAVSHSYENYIKASPDSLFRHQGLAEKYKSAIPSYPGQVYDYYHINRFVAVGVAANAPAWNAMLEEKNADLGHAKQANMAIVAVPEGMGEDYFEAIEQTWIGGKKNDVIAVIATDGKTVKWAHIMAWTDAEMFKVSSRDALTGLAFTPEAVVPVLEKNVRDFFIRKPMKDFEYLTQSITPTTGELIFLMVFGLIVSIGLSYFAFNNDVVDEAAVPRPRYRRDWR